MKKLRVCITVILSMVAGNVYATNGDNLLGVGGVSRAMGGTGIAAPQDTLSASYFNPAAIESGKDAKKSEFDFAATLFSPTVYGNIEISGAGPLAGTHSAVAHRKVYTVPGFGFSSRINDKVRFALSAFGCTGLGVDYRDTALANGLLAANSTQLMILKVAPGIAYSVTDNLSVGASLHVVNSQLDLNQGTSSAYGFGGQVGVLYRVSDQVSVGASYQTPVKTTHGYVYTLQKFTHNDDTQYDFTLASPHTVNIGASFRPTGRLLFETDLKWLNWSNAKGYDILGWDDQYVIAVGAQYKPVDALSLRAGYNYGNNPIKGRTFNGDGIVNVQGKDVNAYGFETLRVMGFPAIAMSHVSAGVGYALSDAIALNLGYTHGFQVQVSSNGTLPTAFGGNPVRLKSQLTEDSLDFSLSWRF